MHKYDALQPPNVEFKDFEEARRGRLAIMSGAVIDIAKYSRMNSVKTKVLAVKLYVGPVFPRYGIF